MAVATPDRPIMQEATLRAVTNKVEVGAAATEKNKRAAKLAVNYQKERAEREDARDSLDRFASGDKAPAELPDRATSEGVIEKSAPDASKPLMKEMDGMIQGMLTGDRTAIDAALDPAATQDQKDALQQTLIDPFKKVLTEMGANIIIDELNTGTPEEINANWVKYALEQVDADRLQGDNRVVDALRENYAAFMKREREDPEDAVQLGRRLDRQKQTEQSLNDEYSGNEKNIGIKQGRLKEFADPTTGVGKELVDAEAKVILEAPDLRARQSEMAELKKELEKYQNAQDGVKGKEKKVYDGDLTRVRGLILTKQGEVDALEKTVRERDVLKSEKERLPGELRQLLSAQDALVPQIDTATKEIGRLEKAVAEATGGAPKTKEDFVKEFQSLTGEAFKEAMIARITAERAAINASIDEMIAKEKDPHVQAVLGRLKESNNRWSEWEEKKRFKVLPFAKKEHKTFEKGTARQDLDALMSGEHGREDYMRRFLQTTTNPDTGLFYTPAERDTMIANKEFMDKAAPKAIAMLVRQAHQNGILKESDIERLSDTEWGKEAFDAALALDKERKSKMEKISAGVGGIENFYSKHKKLAWFLMLSAMAPGAGVVLGVGLLAKGVVTKSAHEIHGTPKEGAQNTAAPAHEPALPQTAPAGAGAH